MNDIPKSTASTISWTLIIKIVFEIISYIGAYLMIDYFSLVTNFKEAIIYFAVFHLVFQGTRAIGNIIIVGKWILFADKHKDFIEEAQEQDYR